MIDRVPEELWTEVQTLYRRQYSRPSLRKRNAKRQNLCLRRPYKYLIKEKKLKAKIFPFECRAPRNSKEK